MKFLRNLLATLLGLFIFSVFAFIIFFAVITGITAEKEVEVKENSVLHLKLNKPIGERSYQDPISELISDYSSNIGLIELIASIKDAKENEKIKGIYLECGIPMTGFASLEAIRNALIDFKTSGKFITAYSEIMTEGGYYLASVADKIYVHPRGFFELNGIGANITFFKGLFDKFGIEPQIFRAGEFKSAVEPFIRKDISAENRLQLNELINSIYGHYLDNVADSRSLEISRLTSISDSSLVRNASQAVKLALITDAIYYDEVLADIRKDLEIEEDDEIPSVNLDHYFKTISRGSRSKNRVAVIIGSGEIHGGKGDNETIGSTTFAKEIRNARTNDDVKAVVIRINSPGGSYLASDVIWREIMLTSEKKPVIASMSDYAASGGYYMAMACDSIVAEPTTITGSIGVFSTIFNLEGLLEDKLGITHDVVKTGMYTDMYTVTRPLSDAEKAMLQNGVEEAYEDFINKAIQKRDMTAEELKSIASGRVWTGIQALENGLVDKLGGLNDAIEMAVKAADVEDDYSIRYYPPKKSFIEEILQELGSEMSAKIVKARTGELYPLIEKLQNLENLKGIQTRMLYDIKIK